MKPRRDKGRGQAANVGAKQSRSDTPKNTRLIASNQDPLVGWFSLAKNVKDRRPTRWKARRS